MKELLDELVAAAERGVTIAVTLPDHPNAGRAYTDDTISWLLSRAPAAAAANRLQFFTLATCGRDVGGEVRYLPVYVHAKVGIVDDRWATIGSANLNSRGMSHDAELNVAALDGDFARGLRLALWSEHMGGPCGASTGWPAPAALPLPRPLVAPIYQGLLALVQPMDPLDCPPAAHPQAAADADASDDMAALTSLADPQAGMALLARRADRNLQRLARGEELVGQLLPYLRCDQPNPYGLRVYPHTGYLDPLHGERTGTEVIHTEQYI
jgi:phosphatidylserine/phosphatidylglycerophosphate/cardiolipin synthase-like enzyme